MSHLPGVDRNEAGDDWARYGGARGRTPDEGADELLRDDPFADYRHENGSRPVEDERSRHRARSNLIGALVAAALLGGAVAIVNLAGSSVTPNASPARTPRPTATRAASGPITPAPRPTLRMARVAVTISIPLPVSVPDRAFSSDDGSTIYLAGNAGALPVNVGAGTVGTVWSGTDFPKGLRRLIYDRGLWVSSWPSQSASCGPPCWDKATTYRIDPATGEVTLALPGTYLVGAQYDGVYVASLGRLRTLDPEDGHELSSIPWKTAGEPRLGCGGLWSVELGSKTELRAVNSSTGNQIGGSSLAPVLTYGPITSEGLCWMISGQGGASAGGTALALLNTDGSVLAERDYEDSMVILDSEFWVLLDDDTIQRFEALSSGIGYGPRFKLPVVPRDGDPGAIFASLGSMWLYQGQELVGLNILTGSGNY